MVEGPKDFQIYLTGVRFKVVIDHGCLQYLTNMKDDEGRLTRGTATAAFDYTISHLPGRDNGNADGLSRQAWELTEPEQEDLGSLQIGGGRSVGDHPPGQAPTTNLEHNRT